MSRRVAAAALTALLLPGAALAAAPWSEPETLSAPHLFIANPGVAFAGEGTAVATWGWQDGTRIAGATTGSRVAFRPAGGVWSAEKTVRGDVAGPPVAYGDDRWGVPTQTLTARSVSTVGVVLGRAGRTPGPQRRIFRGATLARVQLAGNDRGRLALAWQQRRGGHGRAFVALRSPGGSFGRPRVIARGRVRNVSVAVGPRGDVLVAWEERGRIRARGRAPHARRFGRARTIRSGPAFTHDLRTALTDSGRAYVAWTAQFGSEGGSTGPITIRAAIRPAGQVRWRRAQLLDRLAENRAIRGLALDTGPGRQATVAWVGHDGTGYVVRSATATFPGPFEPARDLPAGRGDFRVDDLRNGTLLLTRFFGSGADTGSQVMASQDLGAPVAVSAEEEAYGGRLAADPAGGVTAVWVNRPEGSRRPTREIRTVLQSSSP